MTSFEWAVIGAGPAGIAAVGSLIDHGIDPAAILWLDPEFKVGDFGTKWKQVSSNTKVKTFIQSYEACRAFNYEASPHFEIKNIDPEENCLLYLAAQPLQWISDHLKIKVQGVQAKVLELRRYENEWDIMSTHKKYRARHVILAIGAEPKSLALPKIQEISLETALHPEKLQTQCHPNDVIAIFGSSHSAILIIKTLIEQCPHKKILNFYLRPLRYAVYFDDWILFDDTGLKGQAANWARANLEGPWPKTLDRIISNEENIRALLPQCNKAIYATGFQTRLMPVEGMSTLQYNNRNGMIAPGLFGLGIGFPEAKIDRYGTLEHRVGLRKFMDYIKHVMPEWLKYDI